MFSATSSEIKGSCKEFSDFYFAGKSYNIDILQKNGLNYVKNEQIV